MRHWLATSWTVVILWAAVAAAADVARADEPELTPIAVGIGVGIYALRTLYETVLSRSEQRSETTGDAAILLESVRNLSALLTAHAQRDEQASREMVHALQEWQTQHGTMTERILAQHAAIVTQMELLRARIETELHSWPRGGS